MARNPDASASRAWYALIAPTHWRGFSACIAARHFAPGDVMLMVLLRMDRASASRSVEVTGLGKLGLQSGVILDVGLGDLRSQPGDGVVRPALLEHVDDPFGDGPFGI